MNLNSLESFFNDNYMPHGHCYLWQPHILWTNVISDLVIALAYFSIPIAIVTFVKNRKDIEYHNVALLFSAFILLCGITHAFNIYTIWHGAYGMHGILKSFTAIVSAITAIYVAKILPELINIPTPSQYDGIQKALFNASKNQRVMKMQLEQQRLVQFMLDTMPMSGCLLDSELDIVLANKKFKAEVGCEFDGDPLEAFLTPKHSVNSEFLTKVKRLQKTNNNDSSLKQIIYMKGATERAVPVEASIVQKAFDDAVYYVMTVNYLPEMQKVQQELQESKQRFDRALQASQDGIWEINFVSKTITCSPTFYELIGKANSTRPLTIADWRNHIQPGYESYVFNSIRHDINAGDHFAIEYQGKNAQGQLGWFKLVGKVTKDNSGNLVTMSGALKSIQTNKALEQKVQEKNILLNTLFEGANHGIWVVEVEPGPRFRFVVFNNTAAKWFNAETSQFEGHEIDELDQSILNEETLKSFKINYQACISIGESVTYTESIRINGSYSTKWFQTTLYPIKDVNNSVTKIVGTAIDITPLKMTQAQLTENKRLLENIVDASACGVYLSDISKNVVARINQRFTDILGYTSNHIDAIGSITELYHEQDKDKMKRHLSLTQIAAPGELHSVHMRLKHKNGNWVHCQVVSTVLQKDNKDNPTLMLTSFIDLTEQIMLMQELETSNASLQRFASVASHDLQEPLRKISSFSSMLMERLAPHLDKDEESKFQFSRIIDASNRMSTMISDILRLARINKGATNASTFTLEEAILMAMEPLQMLIDESGGKIKRENAGLKIYADKSLIALLLQNLISNAIKFRRDSVPVIEIDAHSNDSSTIFTVEDNGVGIEEKFLEQIFDTFKRLHPQTQYSGSGIGLAICKQVCQAHGGDIRCESEVGVGSKFIIEIPN